MEVRAEAEAEKEAELVGRGAEGGEQTVRRRVIVRFSYVQYFKTQKILDHFVKNTFVGNIGSSLKIF